MISKRQYNILSFYLTRTLFLGGGFSLLINLSKNDFLITGFLGMLLGYFLLFLFFRKGSVSKVICSFISSVVLLVGVLSNTVLTSNYLLHATPTILIIFVFFISLLYALKKDFQVIGRVVEIFVIVSFFEISLALLSLFNLVEIDRMLPLLNSNTMNVIKGILIFCGASVLPNILLINYRDELKFRDVHFGYIVGCLLMIAVLFFVITIYGSEFASTVRFPAFLILKKIDIMGYISNIENVLVTEWMFNMLISSWVCIRVLKENINKKLFWFIIIILFVFSNFVLNENYIFLIIVKEYFYYLSFIFVILSLVIKKRKN